MLPARANQGQDNTRGQLQLLADADGDGGRFCASTLSAVDNGRVERVYIHAKTAIVDDRWLTIGSANLNERGLYNDTEANVVTDDASLARTTRLRLWAEHLECSISEVNRDPAEVIDARWRPKARQERERAECGEPRMSRLIELPRAPIVPDGSGARSTGSSSTGNSPGLDCAVMSSDEVDEYLCGVDEPKRGTLGGLRAAILEIVPEAEQVISYGVPAFRVHGKTVSGFAAFKDHLSYLPFSGSVLGQLADELEGYTMTKSSLHFPVDRPLPKALVKKLIRARLREIDRRSR